jgi:eukaryotic-like serine/threonine-protein kinase
VGGNGGNGRNGNGVAVGSGVHRMAARQPPAGERPAAGGKPWHPPCFAAGNFVASTISSIGSFQILGTLGQGAHSTILHIRRAADSREYALKVVKISGGEEMKFVDQAKHEFRVAGMLGHPNLIRIYCLEVTKKWFFLVSGARMLIELVPGKTLDETPPLPMKKLVPVLEKIASGLIHMHRRGVYHGDMKPNNVLYGRRGEVKIIDYGLATIKGEAKDRVQGTPEYIAPETARAKVVNEQTDIFNFGATMYRLATLKLPPSAMPSGGVAITEKTWRAMLVVPSEINRSVPGSLSKLILKCLEYRPESRPERMSEVRERLQEIADELGEPIVDRSDPDL